MIGVKRNMLAGALAALALLTGGCSTNDAPPSPGTAQEPQSTIVETAEPSAESAGEDAAEAAAQPLSEEEKAAAEQAALDYYAGTVFEVNSIEYIERGSSPFAEAACNFTVNVSKGGVVQEPNRIISLEKDGGSWTVVSEGY